MEPGPYLDRILDDESLAGDLDEADAAALTKAVIVRAEASIRAVHTEADADAVIQKLRTTGRHIGKTVAAWRDEGPVVANTLANKHGFPSLPATAESSAAVLTFLLGQLAK